MALIKLKEFDPNYPETSVSDNIINFSVYSDVTDEKIGTVKDILVDEVSSKFRYLIVDLGFWIFGKQVLLPIGLSHISSIDERVYAKGLTKEQAKDLPEFNDDLKIDYGYEEQVKNIYRPSATGTLVNPVTPVQTVEERDTYNYQNEPDLYEVNDTDHQSIKLYEERLIANKKRIKTGEVEIGKHVETETARAAVPIEKERVVIERVTPADAGRPLSPGEANFREGAAAKMEIYEETPDIRKEAVLREEVRIRKEVEQDMVNAQETIRREELDVNTQGRLAVDKND